MGWWPHMDAPRPQARTGFHLDTLDAVAARIPPDPRRPEAPNTRGAVGVDGDLEPLAVDHFDGVYCVDSAEGVPVPAGDAGEARALACLQAVPLRSCHHCGASKCTAVQPHRDQRLQAKDLLREQSMGAGIHHTKNHRGLRGACVPNRHINLHLPPFIPRSVAPTLVHLALLSTEISVLHSQVKVQDPQLRSQTRDAGHGHRDDTVAELTWLRCDDRPKGPARIHPS
mmetsp:Transcript_34284/g.74914  ORF Transcript_34284/g.74914 Transcript_34284/m.74914 type:complete len:227 (+) Transcript_34284:188-868(+)